MSDLALRWSSTDLAADLAIEANDLVGEDGLRTAILLSLFTDRRAEATDVLPSGVTDRRGWWADEFSDEAGDEIGSRLWLLDRAKRTPDLGGRIEEYAREALRWLVTDHVAERVEVKAEFPRDDAWDLLVEIWRPRGDPVRFRFSRAWDATAARLNDDLAPWPPPVPPDVPAPPPSLRFGGARITRALSGAAISGAFAAPLWIIDLKNGDLGELGGFGETAPLRVNGEVLPRKTSAQLNGSIYGGALLDSAVIADWSSGWEAQVALLSAHAVPGTIEIDIPDGTVTLDQVPIITGVERVASDQLRLLGQNLTEGTLHDLWVYPYGSATQVATIVSQSATEIVVRAAGAVGAGETYVALMGRRALPHLKYAEDPWITELQFVAP